MRTIASRINNLTPRQKTRQPGLAKLLEAKILDLDGVEERRSRWMNRDAFYSGNREFAHFQSNHRIDVRLTRGYQKLHSNLIKDDPRVKLRDHSSEWITVDFHTKTDVSYACKIVRQALRANRTSRKPGKSTRVTRSRKSG